MKWKERFGVLLMILTVAGLLQYVVIQDNLFSLVTEGAYMQMCRRFSVGETSHVFNILYFNPTAFITKRLGASIDVDFTPCEYKNCKMSLDVKQMNTSDVVIFDGRFIPRFLYRPPRQLWIFAEQEPPTYLYGGYWRREWKASFNLTKTYDREDTDIFWPYGVLRARGTPVVKNYTSIFYKKTRDVVMICSHCKTESKREKFVKILKKYIDVDILGDCGRNWTCGRRFYHDECFEVINKYKFYLAFENSMCRGYFTEKFFENYNYDSIMIVRGGDEGQAVKQFPEGTFISTDSFNGIRELGQYLKNLSSSVTEYTNMLRRKDQYYFPGYRTVYQETMCRLCDRLNNLDQVNSTIPDIVDRLNATRPCRVPTDIYD